MASAGSKRPRSSGGGNSSEDYCVPVEERICPFCLLGHREGLEFSKGFIDILTETNVWATDKPTFVWSGKPYWAHSVCAHFCPRTCYDERSLSWLKVSQEFSRARCLTCGVCGKKGASIGCNVTSCHVSCHFPCAIKELLPNGEKNWFPCQEPSTPFFCLAHKDERARHELGKEVARLSDLVQGREARPILLNMGLADVREECVGATPSRGHGGDAASPRATAQWELLLREVPLPFGVKSTARDMDFAYVASTVGSKSAQMNQGPEREKRCCSCAGANACRDPSKCECLRDGRNYRWKGRRLDEGHPAQIYECNLNCTCHLKSCRNRLVQTGITCNIDVAYLGPSRRLLEGCDKKWGVRAAEDIAVGTFICTVAGQLVLASEAGGVDENGQPSSVLVHRVKDWAAKSRGGEALDKLTPRRDEELLLDQRRYANVSRYIRCARRGDDANLLGVAVHMADQDPTAPVLAFFAGTDIAEGTELVRKR